MSNGLTFEILNTIWGIFSPVFRNDSNMACTMVSVAVQNFKEIGSELTDKLTKNMR